MDCFNSSNPNKPTKEDKQKNLNLVYDYQIFLSLGLHNFSWGAMYSLTNSTNERAWREAGSSWIVYSHFFFPPHSYQSTLVVGSMTSLMHSWPEQRHTAPSKPFDTAFFSMSELFSVNQPILWWGKEAFCCHATLCFSVVCCKAAMKSHRNGQRPSGVSQSVCSLGGGGYISGVWGVKASKMGKHSRKTIQPLKNKRIRNLLVALDYNPSNGSRFYVRPVETAHRTGHCWAFDCLHVVSSYPRTWIVFLCLVILQT